MASGIADISFVSNKGNCPAGYKMLTTCNCGHPANLWKKFIGAPAEERYLCYSSDSKDGKIIEDMYIPGSGERYVKKGYEVIKRTIEGDDSLNCKYLAIKRTSRSAAKSGVADIRVYKAKDNPPNDYRKLGAKLNGLYICVKIVPIDELTDVVPPTTNTAPPPNTRPLPNTGSMSNIPPVSNQAPPTTGPPPPTNTRPLQNTGSMSNMQPPPQTGPSGYPPSTGYTSSGSPYSSGPTTNYPPYSTGAPPRNYPPYSSGAPPKNYPPYSSGAPPTNYPPSYSTGAPPTNYPPYSTGAPPTNYPPYSSGGAPPTNNPPKRPPLSHDTSRSSQDGADLLLGFEHLDLDQPIEFNQEGEFEDTPPDSPVNEEFTVEESHSLESGAPSNPSYSINQPSNPSYSSNRPSFPYGNPVGGGPPPQYYNNQPRYPPQQPYPPPTGPGQFYPPQSQGYPPYNPSAPYRPPPNQGSGNIGFNI